jgi:hypothetical protein
MIRQNVQNQIINVITSLFSFDFVSFRLKSRELFKYIAFLSVQSLSILCLNYKLFKLFKYIAFLSVQSLSILSLNYTLLQHFDQDIQNSKFL